MWSWMRRSPDPLVLFTESTPERETHFIPLSIRRHHVIGAGRVSVDRKNTPCWTIVNRSAFGSVERDNKTIEEEREGCSKGPQNSRSEPTVGWWRHLAVAVESVHVHDSRFRRTMLESTLSAAVVAVIGRESQGNHDALRCAKSSATESS